MTSLTPTEAAPDPLGVLRNRTFTEIAIGDVEIIQRTLTRQDVQLYAVLAGDESLQRPDLAEATETRGVIAHGAWASTLVSTLVATRLPGPGSICLGQSFKFQAPIDIGDRLTISLTVVGRDERSGQVRLGCSAINQNGALVLEGEVMVLAPTQRIELNRATLPEVRLGVGRGGLQRLLAHVRELGSIRVAVVHPCDLLSLAGALDARAAGLIEPVLVAPAAKLLAVADAAGLDLTGIAIEDVLTAMPLPIVRRGWRRPARWRR